MNRTLKLQLPSTGVLVVFGFVLGITDAAYRYWILGESVKSTRQRWSVIRDVLGWVD